MIKNISIGSDPEVFIFNSETNRIESAIGYIPGDKHNPVPITAEGHAIQTDNVMAEFCVPASNNGDKLFADIHHCINTINDILPDNLKVTIKASAEIPDEFLDNEQAQTFGCDPDYNAYSLTQNKAPLAGGNLRSAGGHVHIGYENPTFEDNITIVKALDLFLGIPSVDLDKDFKRKEMYGKAGAFREKEYGVEYRVLSNFWIESPESVNWLVNQINNAIEFINLGGTISDEDQVKIQLAINHNDHDLASYLVKKYNLLFTYDIIKLISVLN